MKKIIKVHYTREYLLSDLEPETLRVQIGDTIYQHTPRDNKWWIIVLDEDEESVVTWIEVKDNRLIGLLETTLTEGLEKWVVNDFYDTLDDNECEVQWEEEGTVEKLIMENKVLRNTIELFKLRFK